MLEHEASVGRSWRGQPGTGCPPGWDLGWWEDARSGRALRFASPAWWRSPQAVPSSNQKGTDLLEDPLTLFFAPDGRRMVPHQRFPVSRWGWVTTGVVSRYCNDVIGGKDKVWQVNEAVCSEQSDVHREATGRTQRATAALRQQQPTAAKRRSCCAGSGSPAACSPRMMPL